jgi:spore germination protein YaaH
VQIRKRFVVPVAVLAVVGAFLVAPAGEASATAVPRPLVTGWLPYWTPTSSAAVLTANKDLFTEGSSFAFSATGATTIVAQGDPTGRATVLGAIHAAGLRAVATVTDGMARHAMAGVIANPTTRAQLVASLVNLTAAGYDGIDLDFEVFAFADGSSTWATTRPNWVAFVAQLSAALHARGHILTAAVPVEYDPALGGGSGYWVYDYKGIAPYVDKLRIMTYDYSFSAAGPIAPLPWVTNVAAWAVTQVPASKIEIGVPTYGKDWVTAVYGTCPVNNPPRTHEYTAAGAMALAASKRITPTWNATYAERTFVYGELLSGVSATGAPASCTVSRTVWYDDASSVMARVGLVGRFNLGGIAMWTIGGEDPAQWAALRGYATALYAKSLPIGHVDAVTVRPGAVEVRGWALARNTSDPIRIQVNINAAAHAVMASLPRGDVGRAYPANGPNHGFDGTFGTTPGVHAVCAYAIGNGLVTPLWCGTVTVPAGTVTAPAASSPFGGLDTVTLAKGTITVRGWTIDPNTTSSINAQLNVDAGYQIALANVSRPDVARALPWFGPLHGYVMTAHVASGRHNICVYGKNVGPGSETTLGCRTVTVP